MTGRMDGRVALVTGGAAGIGAEFAYAFAREGARVAIVDRNPTDDILGRIAEIGGKAVGIGCDVSIESEILRAVAGVQAALGPIKVLVNNAGIYPLASLQDTTADLWDLIFRINARGTFLFCRAVAPIMAANGGGKIVNLASNTFFKGIPYLSAYIASKGAIIGFSRSLARELGASNIQVNAIAPGPTATPGFDAAGLPPPMIEAAIKGQSISRLETPSDLVGAALFFASSDSDFVTGQVLVVDGGAMAH